MQVYINSCSCICVVMFLSYWSSPAQRFANSTKCQKHNGKYLASHLFYKQFLSHFYLKAVTFWCSKVFFLDVFEMAANAACHKKERSFNTNYLSLHEVPKLLFSFICRFLIEKFNFGARQDLIFHYQAF